MRYMVCRLEGLRPHNQISSSLFPIVVEADEYANPEDVVRKALGLISENYVGLHSYVVARLQDAVVVRFRPRQDYDVEVRSY
jgi:hypothetical protein